MLHATVTSIDFRKFSDTAKVDENTPISEMQEKYLCYFSATIDDRGVARVKGLSENLQASEMRQLRRILASHGADFESYRHNGQEHLIDLSRYKPKRTQDQITS